MSKKDKKIKKLKLEKGKKSNRKNKIKKQKKNPAECHHAYLNEIGIKSTECCVFNTREKDASRDKKFKKQREKHSFDSRETWSLDYTLCGWLYEHLMVFKELGSEVVDFTYHEFEIDKVKIVDGSPTFKTVTVNEEEAIDIACDYLHRSLISSWASNDRFVYGQAAMRIVAEIMPSLWW